MKFDHPFTLTQDQTKKYLILQRYFPIIISWQESQFGNRTLRGEFDYELSFDVDDIRNVLDGDDAETSDEI